MGSSSLGAGKLSAAVATNSTGFWSINCAVHAATLSAEIPRPCSSGSRQVLSTQAARIQFTYSRFVIYLRPERRDAEYQEDQGNFHVVQQLESFGTAVVDAQQEYIQLHAKPRASADSPISATTGKHNHVRVCCMQPSYKYPFGSFISWCSAVFEMPYSMT